MNHISRPSPLAAAAAAGTTAGGRPGCQPELRAEGRPHPRSRSEECVEPEASLAPVADETLSMPEDFRIALFDGRLAGHPRRLRRPGDERARLGGHRRRVRAAHHRHGQRLRGLRAAARDGRPARGSLHGLLRARGPGRPGGRRPQLRRHRRARRQRRRRRGQRGPAHHLRLRRRLGQGGRHRAARPRRRRERRPLRARRRHPRPGGHQRHAHRRLARARSPAR